jgi:hypothetical protein
MGIVIWFKNSRSPSSMNSPRFTPIPKGDRPVATSLVVLIASFEFKDDKACRFKFTNVWLASSISDMGREVDAFFASVIVGRNLEMAKLLTKKVQDSR